MYCVFRRSDCSYYHPALINDRSTGGYGIGPARGYEAMPEAAARSLAASVPGAEALPVPAPYVPVVLDDEDDCYW